MTRSTAPQSEASLTYEPVTDRVHATTLTSHVQTLLYGLSLVTALPPEAILAPPDAVVPKVRSDPHPILHAVEVESVLDRPITPVGHGSVALEHVDWRYLLSLACRPREVARGRRWRGGCRGSSDLACER